VLGDNYLYCRLHLVTHVVSAEHFLCLSLFVEDCLKILSIFDARHIYCTFSTVLYKQNLFYTVSGKKSNPLYTFS